MFWHYFAILKRDISHVHFVGKIKFNFQEMDQLKLDNISLFSFILLVSSLPHRFFQQST